MTDDMRLLLRILLEQELREAEPEMQRPRKKREAEREDGIDYAPAESRGKTKRTKDTMKEERAEDLQQARSDMYSTHENVAYNMRRFRSGRNTLCHYPKQLNTSTSVREGFDRSLQRTSMPSI